MVADTLRTTAGTELPPQRAPISIRNPCPGRWTATPAWSVVQSVQSERTVPAAPVRRIRSHADRGSAARRRHQHEHADQTQNRRRQRRTRPRCGGWNSSMALFASRRRAGGLPASAVKAASRSSGADSNRQSGPTVVAPNRSPVCGTNAPQMSSARRRSQSCRSPASRSAFRLMIRREPDGVALHRGTCDRLGFPLAVRHPMRKQRLPHVPGKQRSIRRCKLQPALRLVHFHRVTLRGQQHGNDPLELGAHRAAHLHAEGKQHREATRPHPPAPRSRGCPTPRRRYAARG